MTSKRHQLLKKQLKASQAIKRLETFFPGAKRDNVDFKAVVRKVENERQAVKKMLNLGYVKSSHYYGRTPVHRESTPFDVCKHQPLFMLTCAQR